MHGRLGSKGRCVSDAGDDKDLGFFCFRVLSHLNLMTVLFDGCYYKSYCMKSDSESLEKVINCFMFGSAGSLLLHRLFSSCGEWRLLFVTMCRLLIAVASLAWSTGLGDAGFRS